MHPLYKYKLDFTLVEPCAGHESGEEEGRGEHRPKPTLLLLPLTA